MSSLNAFSFGQPRTDQSEALSVSEGELDAKKLIAGCFMEAPSCNMAFAKLPWYVVHTRPRCEKKLAAFCEREGISVTLPCFKSVKRYTRKVVEFSKPLFPGYLFFKGEFCHARKVRQNGYTARILTVSDQGAFERQLGDILFAIESGYVVSEAVGVRVGKEVRILDGPLAGIIGVVSNISNQTMVILRLDFLGQGAAAVVNSANLEIIN